MTAHISAYGRLVADPERRETRTGKFWATGRMAVTLPKPPGDPEEAEPPTLWLSVTAFGGKGAGELARHRKGDSLSVAGRLELRRWTTSDGEARESWTCMADSVIGPRTGRPGGRSAGKGRRPAGQAEGGTQAPPPFDDEVPF